MARVFSRNAWLCFSTIVSISGVAFLDVFEKVAVLLLPGRGKVPKNGREQHSPQSATKIGKPNFSIRFSICRDVSGFVNRNRLPMC
jgi:hypothetical protein